MNLLCAVGQRETPWYTLTTMSLSAASSGATRTSASRSLAWRPDTCARAALEDLKGSALELPLTGLQAELLPIASRCAVLELQLASLDPSRLVEAHEAFVVETWRPSLPPEEAMRGAAALRRAAYMSLRAVCRLSCDVVDAFRRSVLAYQLTVEVEWLGLRHGSRCDESGELNRWLLRKVMSTAAVLRKLWGPLSSLDRIFDECSRLGAPNEFGDVKGGGNDLVPTTVEKVCATVINALTMLGGSMQACRAEGHHSLVLMLLLCGCWPWVETLVWVASGSVPMIDEREWLAQAPTLFSMPLELPCTSSLPSEGGSAHRDGGMRISTISLVAGCEGIVRHVHWRAANSARQSALAEVLAVLEEATSPGHGPHQRRTPLRVRLSNDGVAVLRCSHHPLSQGVIPLVCDAAGLDAEVSACIHVDLSMPVSTWVSQLVLRPIGDVVRTAQRTFVAELLTKPLPIPSAGNVDSWMSSTSHAALLPSWIGDGAEGGRSAWRRTSVTFLESLDCVAKTALFCDWERMGEKFIDRIARLPGGWWVTAPTLLTAAFSECCSADGAGGAFATLRVSGPPSASPSMQRSGITTASLLELFQGAELSWDLPEQHRVILFPSLYYSSAADHEAGGHEADDGSVGSGITPAFTKVFRLMAVLFLTHRLLLEHWKTNNSHGGAGSRASDEVGVCVIVNGDGVPTSCRRWKGASPLCRAAHFAFCGFRSARRLYGTASRGGGRARLCCERLLCR